MKKRPMYQTSLSGLKEPGKFIQVLLGPGQVGKTTLPLQILEEVKKPYQHASPDLASLRDLSWIRQQWVAKISGPTGKTESFESKIHGIQYGVNVCSNFTG